MQDGHPVGSAGWRGPAASASAQVLHVTGLPPGSHHSDTSTLFALANARTAGTDAAARLSAAVRRPTAQVQCMPMLGHCSAGLGRIQSVIIREAAGTMTAVTVQDAEAVDRVVAALAKWGPQVGILTCDLHVLMCLCACTQMYWLISMSTRTRAQHWELQMMPFAEWSRSCKAGGDADMADGQAASAASGAARERRLGDENAPIKGRRLL